MFKVQEWLNQVLSSAQAYVSHLAPLGLLSMEIRQTSAENLLREFWLNQGWYQG